MLSFFQKLFTKTDDLTDQELSENAVSLQSPSLNNGIGLSKQSAKVVDYQLKQLNYLKELSGITDQLFPENLISFKGQNKNHSFRTAEQLINRVDEQFDELYYLKENPDVVAAIASGAYNSGLEHYLAYGQYEGRAPCYKPKSIVDEQFDELYYLKANADVAAAIDKGRLNSGFEHYQRFGKREGRAPCNKSGAIKKRFVYVWKM
jgi:hypothetical protein